MNSVKFGDKDSYKDWGLILKPKSRPLPTPKTNYVSIEGKDGDLDLTTSLTGDVKYNNLSFSLEFTLMNKRDDWETKLYEITTYLQGKKMKVVFSDDPDWYYVGRMTLDGISNNKNVGTIKINCNVEPYRLKVDETIINEPIVADKEITLPNSRKWVMPTIEAFHENIIPITATSQTIEGVEFKVDENITINGTATNDLEYEISNEDFTLEKNVDYHLTKPTFEETLTGNEIYIQNGIESEVKSLSIDGYSIQDGTPTPDAPIEIEVVKGSNLLDVSNFENGYYDSTGTFVEHAGNALFDYIKVKADKYVITTNTIMTNLTFVCFDKDKNFLSRSMRANTDLNALDITSDVSYIRVCANLNNTTELTSEVIETLDLMLSRGENINLYVPYGYLGVEVANKNFLKKITEYGVVSNGDATIETIDDYLKVIMPTSPYNYSGFYFKNYGGDELDINTTIAKTSEKVVTYSFYAKADEERTIKFGFGDRVETYITLTTEWKRYSRTFTMNSDAVPTFYCGDTLNTSSFYIKNIMLEVGSTLTDYEEKEIKQLLINLQGNELCSIGDIKDTLDIKDEKAYLTKKIGKVVLDGSENWTLETTKDYTQVFRLEESPTDVGNIWNFLSSHFQSNIDGDVEKVAYASSYFYIAIRKTIASTVEEFVAWLSENNVEILYELATPIVETTDNPSISIYENVNNVSNSEDANMTIIYSRGICFRMYDSNGTLIYSGVGGVFSYTEDKTISKVVISMLEGETINNITTYPKLELDENANVNFVFEGKEFAISGVVRTPDIILKEGGSKIILKSGLGNIKISYVEGKL